MPGGIKCRTISSVPHNSLRVLAAFGLFVFEWFWRNRFLKGQTTSDEIFQTIFITKQIVPHNFALPPFFEQIKWSTISTIPHNFLRVLAEFGLFFERFWGNRFLEGQTTSDEIFQKIFITKQILLHNFALPLFFRPDKMGHHIINPA